METVKREAPYKAKVPFTPGPWWACCIDDDYARNCHCGYIFTHGNGEGTIGRVYYNDPKLPDDYCGQEDIITLEQRNANACLLAASPTMHAALLKARDALVSGDGEIVAITAIDHALKMAVTMDLS